MTPRVYPFIDIAVLDAVRGHFLAGDAIAILSTDLETVIWANGPGAALFGHGDIESVRGAPANLGFPARRQIAGTPGFPSIGQNRSLLVRVAQGVTSRAIGFLASQIALPDGVRAIMLVAPDLDSSKRGPAEIAARAIHGIAEAEHHAALIDGAGQVISASAGFGATGIAAAALAELAGDVMLEADRLAKRLVPAGDVAYPVGIARLGEDPARHLVIVVDDPQPLETAGEDDDAVETAAEAASHPVAEAAAAPETSVARAPEKPAAADDSDNWYFADVAPARTATPAPEATADAGRRGEILEEPPLAGAEESPAVTEADAGGETRSDDVNAPSTEDEPVAEASVGDAVEQDVSEPVSDAADNDDVPPLTALTPANDVGTAEDATVHDTQQQDGATEQAFAAEEASAEIAADQDAAPVFKPDLKSGPVRFVWRTDAEGRFSAISDEFGGAVGKAAADIVGRPFRDVALTFALDPEGDIAGLLERRDTWSGRSVMWPIEGTDLKVPVDLAALPVYARDRSFEGFRGFGVVRVGDAIVDEEAIGLSLARTEQPKAPPADVTDTPSGETAEPPATDPFAGEIPAIAVDTTPERRQTDKVIRLAEHRPPNGERTLSTVEKNAFREIGARLTQAGAGPEAATDDDPTAPAGPEDALDTLETIETEETAAELDGEADAPEPVEPVHLAETRQEPEAVVGPTDESGDEQIASDAPDQESGELWPAYDPGEIEAVSADEPLDDPRSDAEMDAAAPAERDESEARSEPDGERGGTLHRDAGADQVSGELWPAYDPGEIEAVAADEQPELDDIDATDPISSFDGEETDFAPPTEDHDDGFDVAERGDPRASDTTFDDEAEHDDDARLSKGVDTSILERLPVPVLIHSGDRLHYANEEFLELTGYVSVLELEQAGGLDALFIDDDEAERETDDHRRRLRSRNGEEFRVDALLQSVPWNGGKALLLALKPAPIVAQPMASEEELDELESRVAEMSTILDTATDGIVIIGNDGSIRSISRPAEALFGFDTADVSGKPFVSLFAVESQRAARDYLNGLSDNGVASVLNDGREVIGREAQGRFIPLFMTIGKLPGANGYCAVLRDITQWKRAEEELTQARAEAERASSQKTDFLARISHEIRTPLNAIIGFSELMIDEKFGPIVNDRYRDYLRDINRSGNHVLDLVNDLLDISKIEAGEQEMAYEAVSLNETLAETVAMMQPQANRDRVIIRSSFASRLPEVVADLRSVRQIAINLLSNAVRYTQAGGQVIVSTSYEPTGDVVMRVRDTGVGMSQGEIEQALKPFKQINALKRTRGDGTGLGLPLTKAMVEANRARFTIHSAPGEGTMVEVVFPSTRVLAG
jgi:PAS domain S-box-containing protein